MRSLTEGSISRGMVQFALPILYASVLQSLNASVNSVWVGRFLGEAALTATSNANVVMFLLIGIAFGIAMAATIIVAQRIGANDIRGARHAVGTSATFFAGVSVLMAIAGLTLSPAMLIAMKTPPQSLPLAIAYMRVIFCALPSLYMYAFVMAVLRAAGDSKTPFYFMLLSVGLDITLNPVFIFGVGPVPRLGIAGSALATFIAQTVSLVAMVRHLYRRRNLLCLRGEELRFLRVDWQLAGALLRKGIPMGGQITVMSLSGVLMISLVNRFGVDTTAAFGAALQIWNYIQMPAFAVGQAVSAMAAQNVGAGKWERVNRIAVVGVAFSIAVTGSVILILELLGASSFSPFLPAGSPGLAIGAHLNHIATPSYMFFAIAMVLFATVRSTGAVMLPFAIMTVSLLLVRFPLAYAFIPRFHADAIWWSFPISSAIAAVLGGLYYRFGDWRAARMMSGKLTAELSTEAPGA
ncbi:MAG TPA: MATE family efflux transporter [Steroidobacteraceae bacterium]|nr:MATE family efflux transporter [Steroidobacteraceae bacterium]